MRMHMHNWIYMHTHIYVDIHTHRYIRCMYKYIVELLKQKVSISEIKS